jgi:hypothetical protein
MKSPSRSPRAVCDVVDRDHRERHPLPVVMLLTTHAVSL